MTLCIACGMPMQEPADFAQSDPQKNYCRFCARPDGTMQSYEEKVANMAQFIVKTQGLDPIAAQNAARTQMDKLPA